jgi:hypothetical protein
VPYTIYDRKRDCDITTPRGMRITDGPEMLTWFQDWPDVMSFYRVEDTEYDTVKYCTPLEAQVLTGCSYEFLRRKTFIRIKKPRLYDQRYLITCIPRIVFVDKTGRDMREVREYKYSY